MVQAHSELQRNRQAFVIEKQTGGAILSGDKIYLRAHTGAYIDVEGSWENGDDLVRARWVDKGTWQTMTIVKRADARWNIGNDPIFPGDIVCVKAYTGKHVRVDGAGVRAGWSDCLEAQAMRIQRDAIGAVVAGASIRLLAHTGKHIDVEGFSAAARWNDHGDWQTLVIDSYGSQPNNARPLYSGDAVYLRSHRGRLLGVQGVAVVAGCPTWRQCTQWHASGEFQKFVIERQEGDGAIMPSDVIFLRAYTGRMLDVEGDSVRCRWFDYGRWQTLKIEMAEPRRLIETSGDVSSRGFSPGFLALP